MIENNEAELLPSGKESTGTLMSNKSTPVLKLKSGETLLENGELEMVKEEEIKKVAAFLPLISTKSELKVGPQPSLPHDSKQVHFKEKGGLGSALG